MRVYVAFTAPAEDIIKHGDECCAPPPHVLKRIFNHFFHNKFGDILKGEKGNRKGTSFLVVSCEWCNK